MKSSDQQQRAALEDLERLKDQGGLLTNWLRHTTAAKNDIDDPIEWWGRLIGRGLAVVAFLGLCVYFYFTYGH